MRLNFPYIEIEGLRSFVRKTRINLASAGTGLHFVKGLNTYAPRLGSNGAGKSTIWGALTWCLYGQTLAGLKRPDLKPWYGDAELCVTVGVENDGKISRVSRRAGRITIDGKTAGQEQIDKLLGYMPLEVFGHTIVFAQGRQLFFDLEPAKKMRLFTTMLMLDRWDRRSEKASSLVKEIDIGKLPTLSASLKALDSEQTRIQQQLQQLQSDSESWEQRLSERLNEWNSELTNLRVQLKAVSKKWGDADLALERAGMELQPQQKVVDAMQNNLTKLESFHNGLVITAQNNLRRLDREVKTLGDGKRCPSCGQPTKGTALNKHHSELLSEIAKYRKQLADRSSHNKIVQFADKLRKHIKLRDTFADKVEAAHTALDRLGPQKAELQTKISGIESKLSEHADEHNPYLNQLRSLKKRIADIKREQEKLNDRQKQLDRERSQAVFWVKGFKEVKLYQITEILQELELATNNMLDDMGLEGWEICYEIEKDNKSGGTQRGLHVMILSPDNDDFVKWEVWSGGEGQRLRVVGALALSEVLLNHAGIETGMMVLDEPTQHLSTEGIADICEFLSGRAYELNQQIWFADHKVIEGDYFNRTLLVIKDRDGSRIGGL